MLSFVMSAGVKGVKGYLVRVEADISQGMPMLELVGFLGSEVREAGQRVRTALKNAGYSLPIARVTVNLAPANIKKSGSCYDLPIALSILACMQIIPSDRLKKMMVVGEILLSGKVCAVKGVLPMILEAKSKGIKTIIIPEDNRYEGMLVEGVKVYGVSNIVTLIRFLRGEIELSPYDSNLSEIIDMDAEYENDFEQVIGQKYARRAIEIAASGLHNLLMIGSPGAGKTMLAKCIPSILPRLTENECLEISSIYSVYNNNNSDSVMTTRPFVMAHHTTTDIALIGGGLNPKPGAVSLAHTGVLFLDELPEFSRKALEALRQPLEDRKVTIIRNNDYFECPADFMLVAAMNPCPCGYYPDLTKCRCTVAMREKYLAKISGPLMDRIDLCVSTERIAACDLKSQERSESSNVIRDRVLIAHQIQRDRFQHQNISFNSQMNNSQINKYCSLSQKESNFLNNLASKYELSARSYYRILKIARTIADLDGKESIEVSHLAEAARLKLNLE